MKWFKRIYNHFSRRFTFSRRLMEHPKILTISDSELRFSSFPDLDGFSTEEEAIDYIAQHKKRDYEVLIYELKKCVKIKIKTELTSCKEMN